MTINILCTSKPCDGLFYYSYEYCSLLNAQGFDSRVIVITNPKFSPKDYTTAINEKYVHCKNIVFDNYVPDINDVTFVTGRSMITLPWKDFQSYTRIQQTALKVLLGNKIIAVYSENHPTEYHKAVDFYQPNNIIDLCDKEVYPNGVGSYFEKTINFAIHKPVKNDIQFKYLFLGTNEKYYQDVEKIINQFSDHGILTYDADYVNPKNNNIFVPTQNLLGKFETYVYTKSTFDPAPRIFQECRYFDKDIIYHRDVNIRDGGNVYWNRQLKKPDTNPIINAVKGLL